VPVRRPAALAGAVLAAVLALTACSDDGPDDAAVQDASTTAVAVATSDTATPSSSPPTSSRAAEPASVFDVIPRLVEQVQPSVVTVRTTGGEGSGVIYREDGIVVTNHHVVAGASSAEVVFADGGRATAQVLATDPLTDLAVLDTGRDDLPAARFATELPRVGALAVAMGNPLGFENSVTAGIVSGLHRDIPGSTAESLALVDLIQTDAAISPGNSGGALVGETGEVLGINVAYIPPTAGSVSIGFAIPAATVTDTVEELLATGQARHAFVGIRPVSLTPALARRFGLAVDEGVLVAEVVPDGPADVAGMRPGDVIVEMAGSPLASAEAFIAVLRGIEPGETVPMEVVRGGERLELSVTVSDRPAG